MSSAVESIGVLVDRFKANAKDYMASSFNETQARIDFIDPMLGILGWDVRNEAGVPEAYRDVIHEDRVRIGGGSKAPDYGFYIGGERKFFLEAKKPSVNIRDSTTAAVQLRRYAWSARLPVGILTDFEEFAVYDCRIEPMPGDKPETALISFFRFEEYETRWSEISDLFSRQAVMDGSLERFALETPEGKGIRTVDQAFLSQISTWRSALAQNLAENNDLTGPELNYAVQMTIDRIVFLRIAEDRGTEEFKSLFEAARSEDVYAALLRLFVQADERYNSGLFHFQREKGRLDADELSAALVIDHSLLRDILDGLYFPRSAYVFSVFPVEVLGQIYEQFLGSVVVPDGPNGARVEEKPEVRKAGGVYYTPSHIVDHMIKATVGRYLEDKRPGPRGGATRLKILDPACGSGSFLLGAYQYLLDWHRDKYIEEGPEKHSRFLYQGPGGIWHLTIDEKKRILQNNIFGVDADPQAVEVTKLSLLLKVLEGETGNGLDRQLALIQARVLPDLDKNIRCGNSLIDLDVYDNGQMALMATDMMREANAFDWKTEFSDVFAGDRPGFDVVVGNPPYIDSEWMTQFRDLERRYCTAKYKSASGNWDIFCVFVERAFEMCATDGVVSLIIPNKLGSAAYAQGARTVAATDNRMLAIRDYSSVRVFPVAVYPIVFLGQKRPPGRSPVTYEKMSTDVAGRPMVTSTRSLAYAAYFGPDNVTWPIFSGSDNSAILAKLRKLPNLGDVAEVLGAATVGEAYEIKELISELDTRIGVQPGDLKLINSGTIDRYASLWGTKNCRYLGTSLLRPIIDSGMQERLPKKRFSQSHTPKLIFAGMTKILECMVDADGSYIAGKSTTIVFSDLDLSYLLGVMNSKLINYYYDQTFGGDKLQGGYLRVGPPQIRTIPIVTPASPRAITLAAQIGTTVSGYLETFEEMKSARIESDRVFVKQKLNILERRIDDLVYKLYGLTAAEIEIVDAFQID